MKNVMLDIETFGTSPGCAIRSIGAVTFDLNGTVGETFYVNVNLDTCLEAGLVVDPKTADWWARQSADAQRAFEKDQKSLHTALLNFRTWFLARNAPFVWSQGANFDPPVLDAAYRAMGIEVPWRFYNVRDTRTVYDLFGFDTRDIARKRIHHNALDDTLHQVDLVAAALRLGRVPTEAPAVAIAAGIFD